MGNYYVNPSGGSDLLDGRTPETAWQTEAPINAASPLVAGDVVHWKRGTSRTLAADMIPRVQLHFRPYHSGAAPIINGATVFNCFHLQGVSGTIVDGFRLENGLSAIRVSSAVSSNCIFRNLDLQTFSDSIIFFITSSGASTGTLCEQVRFRNGLNDGFSIFGSGNHTVRRCTFNTIGDYPGGIGGGQGDGVTTHETGTCVVEDCEIDTVNQGGVVCINTAGTNYVRRCFIKTPTQYGVQQGGTSPNGGTMIVEGTKIICTAIAGAAPIPLYAINGGTLKAYNCTLWLDETDIVYFGHAEALSTLWVYNTIFSRSGSTVRYLNGQNGTVLSDYNRFSVDATAFRTAGGLWTFANWQAQSGNDLHSSVGDPGLVGGSTPTTVAQMDILAASACRNAGTVPAGAGNVDYYGMKRAAPWDIGAHEYTEPNVALVGRFSTPVALEGRFA